MLQTGRGQQYLAYVINNSLLMPYISWDKISRRRDLSSASLNKFHENDPLLDSVCEAWHFDVGVAPPWKPLDVGFQVFSCSCPTWARERTMSLSLCQAALMLAFSETMNRFLDSSVSGRDVELDENQLAEFQTKYRW